MKKLLSIIIVLMLSAGALAQPENIFWRMVGSSMEPTIQDNDILSVDLGMFAHRGDIVICNVNSTIYCKRLVAVPGDALYRKNGVTCIVYYSDGIETTDILDNKFSAYYPDGSPMDFEKYTLGSDEYFVVGDNRYLSHDSRDWDGPVDKELGGNDGITDNDFGPISSSLILGKVQGIVTEIEYRDFGSEYVPNTIG